MSLGVCFITYGEPAVKEAEQAIETLQRYHDWPITIAGESEQFPDFQSPRRGDYLDYPDLSGGYPGRYAKVTLPEWSPYEYTLFLDADVRVRSGALSVGFHLLHLGWEMVMVASQFDLSHLTPDDQQHTAAVLPHLQPVQYNTGVMWFQKTYSVCKFFTRWRGEWERFKMRDQGAFLRALYKTPIKVCLLGYPFNSSAGAVINHRFGQADRGCQK
jgi:hypothetical protein